MHSYKIKTSLGVEYETKYRATGIDAYCKQVEASFATRGKLAGQSVSFYHDGVRVFEHVGKHELRDKVEARIIAIENAPTLDL